ncbi:hypothetical protein [Maribacter sp. HTCC2170]|uniref:hypothetical protein n=1 Tax=Maribacter sp. (strain HTCC2170 / KCCM 42371) TaxID=313603 RepID=UPI00006BD50E|nr:hypothetical protein [Maribacter sp. HTCC2170]EAR02851.1 hypothetical protein FB2170_06170 [Maribacter sp. HTCC2170]
MNSLSVLEVGNLDGLVAILFLIMFGPAIVLVIIGFALRANEKKKASKVLFILAGVYLLISLGICGGLMGGF